MQRETVNGRYVMHTRRPRHPSRRQRFARLRKTRVSLQAIGLGLVAVGILLAVVGASWNPHTGMGGHLGAAVIGVVSAVLGSAMLQQDIGQGCHER